LAAKAKVGTSSAGGNAADKKLVYTTNEAYKAADIVSDKKTILLGLAKEAEQAAKVAEVYANKAVLDSKIELHKAAVAAYREATLHQAETHASQTTLNGPTQMKQFESSDKAIAAKKAVADALEVVEAEEKVT
jgi:hypothetical protein